MGRCGPADEAAVPALVRVLEESEDHGVHEAVVEGLGRIGPPAAQALPAIAAWAQANPWGARQAGFASGAIRGEHPSYLAAMGAGLADADPGVRQDAARLLRRLAYSERDRAEVLILPRAALDDPDPDVVIRACTGIAAFGREAEACLPTLRGLRRRGAPVAGFAIRAIERAETRAAGE